MSKGQKLADGVQFAEAQRLGSGPGLESRGFGYRFVPRELDAFKTIFFVDLRRWLGIVSRVRRQPSCDLLRTADRF